MAQRKNYLSILRILAIMMVFHFHFILVLERQGLLWGFANGDWGFVGTSLFFLISGNCLARNYGKSLKIGTFYKKRWLAIFPAFYLCYVLVLFGYTVIMNNRVLAGIEPWRIIFTLLGIDNYLTFFGIRTPALVGEWYTAIIVAIYVIFPVLQYLYRKSKLLGSIIVYGLYTINLFCWSGPLPVDAHLLTGVAIFWTGMLIYHFEKYLEKMPWFCWCAILALALVLFQFTLPGPMLLWKTLMAVCIFLLILRLGSVRNKSNKVIDFFGQLEYGFYLCHHTVLYVMQSFFLRFFGKIKPVPYYIVCLAAALLFSAVITYAVKWITGALAGKKAV